MIRVGFAHSALFGVALVAFESVVGVMVFGLHRKCFALIVFHRLNISCLSWVELELFLTFDADDDVELHSNNFFAHFHMPLLPDNSLNKITHYINK